MISTPLHRAFLLPLGLMILFLLSAAGTAFADCPNQRTFAVDDPFHMLVLGDSIMWGQGLKEDEKFSSRIRCWLQEKVNREVKVHVEAHSGAVISGGSSAQPAFIPASGEVNSTTPTINQQLDHAVQFYTEHQSSPSLILMNGCINDVGVKNLLAASTSLEDLRAQARTNCGENMRALLQRMTDKEMRERLIAISDEWYKASTVSLLDAVQKTNASGESEPFSRVSFVEILFGPEHLFAAPDSLLWNFKFASTNLSGFTKIIVLVSFGTAAYKPNDHVRESRVKSCEETFKKPKGIKEDKKDKTAREDLFLICRYASLGHPNQMGALIYTEAIKGQLLQLIDKAGWKRDTNNTQSVQ